MSATRNALSEAAATPDGWLSDADLARPPAPPPATTLPATVLIVAAPPAPTATRRTRPFFASAIRKPLPKATTAFGWSSSAALGSPPSPANPASPFPAIVVIVPSGETLRTLLLKVSAITKPPSGSAKTL